MRVFVIPTRHPTPMRPLWCNWVLPHIALLRESGVDAYVLQLGLDDEPIPDGTDPWNQSIRFPSDKHLYVPVPRATTRYQRSRFSYGRFLRRYTDRLRDMFKMAVEKWGSPDILDAHVFLPAGFCAAQLWRDDGIAIIVQEH